MFLFVVPTVIVLPVAEHHRILRVILRELHRRTIYFQQLMFNIIIGVPLVIIGHFVYKLVLDIVDLVVT